MSNSVLELHYLLLPFFTWAVTGVTKFGINSIKTKQLAWKLIGYGGMPSNHSAIVSAIVALIGFREGIGHPAFGVAITFAFIVILDAASLRNQVGMHASVLNQLTSETHSSEGVKKLRERMGHKKSEIAAGILVGISCAYVIFQLG